MSGSTVCIPPPRTRNPILDPLEQRWLCLGFDACLAIAGGGRLDDAQREELLRAFGV